MSDVYLFEDRGGQLVPVLPISPTNERVIADGKRFYDLDGAAGRLGRSREALIADWHAYWGDWQPDPQAPVLVEPPTNSAAKAVLDVRRRVLRATKFANLSDDFFELLLADIGRRGLSLEHVAARVEEPYRRGEKAELKIITTLQAFRLIAQRTGQRDGEGRARWAGPDGNWSEVWSPKNEPPHVALWEVKRKDQSLPYACPAYWEFHHQKYQDAAGNWQIDPFWANGAPHMLAKCSLALGYKAGWPDDEHLGGLFTNDEMRADGRSRFARDLAPREEGSEQGERVAATPPPSVSLLVDDPRVAWSLVDPDSTPDNERGLILALLELVGGGADSCKTLIAMFKSKLPMIAKLHYQAFAAVVLKAVRDNPGPYGSAA